MKICIPTADDRGLDAVSAGHLGGAPYYTVVDTETSEVLAFPRRGHRHGQGGCGPGDLIQDLGVNTVVCAEIGRRAFASLRAAGITVLVSDACTVSEILAAARENRLIGPSAKEICGGHGMRHGQCTSP